MKYSNPSHVLLLIVMLVGYWIPTPARSDSKSKALPCPVEPRRCMLLSTLGEYTVDTPLTVPETDPLPWMQLMVT